MTYTLKCPTNYLFDQNMKLCNLGTKVVCNNTNTNNQNNNTTSKVGRLLYLKL